MSRSLAMRFRAYLGDESGATAIEYALIAAGVFLGIVTVVQTMGDGVSDMYTQIAGFFDA